MKKFYYLFTILTLLSVTGFDGGSKAFGIDTVSSRTETIYGKFDTVSDGLIIINQNGVKKSFVRVEDRYNVYRDYITYKVSPFSTRIESTPCKILFLDKFNVRFKTPTSNSIEIHRYRVKDLNINIK